MTWGIFGTLGASWASKEAPKELWLHLMLPICGLCDQLWHTCSQSWQHAPYIMTIEVPKYDFLTSHEVIFIENTTEKPYFLKNRKIIFWTHFASLLLPDGRLLGSSWRLSGPPLAILGAVGLLLGPPCEHLGAIMPPSWAIWESSWSHLGASWGCPGHIGLSWSHPGGILLHFWAIWLQFWSILAPSGSIFCIFLTSLWCHWLYLFDIRLVYCFDHLLQISVLLYDMEACNCSMYSFDLKHNCSCQTNPVAITFGHNQWNTIHRVIGLQGHK